MSQEKNQQHTAASSVHEEPPPPERTHFAALLLANPNYFGNLEGSSFKSVLAAVENPTYEELKCAGYNPELDLLEAVVWIKRSSGYLGDLCSAGSNEYVRFFLSFDNGATWQDQGIVSFNVHDSPGPRPLEYGVTLQPQPRATWCFREVLPLVRAILSWNVPPPSNTPNYKPAWGNVVDAHIQVRTVSEFAVADLLADAKVSLPAQLQMLVSPDAKIATPAPVQLGAAELAALYKDKGVHEHRYLYPTIHSFLAKPGSSAAYAAFGSKGPLEALQIDLAAVIAAIGNSSGDTGYEQLTCIGFDPNGIENLVGVLSIKRPVGYGGGACTHGSHEYVAFWIDWGDGSGWNWVGTAQVGVHDFRTIPPDGLRYAVAQPINTAAHRRPCLEGPVTARVRAVLSWAVPPPPANPDYVPTWGNRLETRIEILPGTTTVTGDYTPYIESVCAIDICDVDPATGLAPGDRPFGGSIYLYGIIPGAPMVSTPEASRPRYRVQVAPHGTSAWQAVNDSFDITMHQQILPGPPVVTSHTQTADPGGYYTYQVAPNVPGLGWRDIVPSGLLAVWNTLSKTGKWDIMIDAYNPVGPVPYPAGGSFCAADGTLRSMVTVDLDNAAPIPSLAVTGFSRGGGPVQPAVDCATFQVGDVIHGTYSVFDEHFGALALVVEPAGHAGGATVNPASRSYPTVPNTGESGTWTLDTHGMDPCGYTIQLQTNDRTIVSCGGPWRNDTSFVGFCLVAPPQE
jgi:hypothetical protein